MPFTCFHTVHDAVPRSTPITYGYDASRRTMDLVRTWTGRQFIHSGNWWNITPEKRTKEIVLEAQVKKINKHVVGLMSMNVQPGNEPMYWINDDSTGEHMQECLANAIHARDELENQGINAPLYCALQPSTKTMAEIWFQKAIDNDFQHLCVGVSEFLRSPKYRKEGIGRIFEFVITAHNVLGDTGKLHLSGLMSYAMLPVVARLGVTSTDGSTPVQSALAYGSVFTPGTGRGTRASQLIEKNRDAGWKCDCMVCNGLDLESVQDAMQDRSSRVQHNIHAWTDLVDEINHAILPNPSRWFHEHEESISKTMRRYWMRATSLLDSST
ncbi:hypothetical protein GF325_05565 [Candidatus Bathyarchaeota archaeon]|nr:hypothetical protein [Candidatus Bathyarchaeota archaeon]